MAPVLSICIPTCNRGGYLYFTLKSIVEQHIFKNTQDIEIVIFDNGSTDTTEKISKLFVDKYPNKIIYKRIDSDLCGDERFEKVLRLGSGEVLKLHNDNYMFKDGALELIVSKIKEFGDEKPVLFFSNGNSRVNKSVMCNNLNEFVESASYLTTWIASFSIWKEDFDKFEDFSKNLNTNLIQADVLFRMSSGGKKMFIMDDQIFIGQGVLKKGGYNIAKVFGKNYLGLLKKYLGSDLDKEVYEKEKKVLLLNHIIPMRFVSAIKYSGWVFQNQGYWRYLIKNYWYNLYLYLSIFKILKCSTESELNIIGQKLNRNSYQKYWKKRNKHNQTTIFAYKNS